MPPSPQRRFPRIRSEHPVRVRRLGHDEADQFGSTEVVGLGGCSVVVDRRFPVGDLVELEIPLPEGMVLADGRIVYENRVEGGGRELGIEFLKISPRHLARIRPLLQERS